MGFWFEHGERVPPRWIGSHHENAEEPLHAGMVLPPMGGGVWVGGHGERKSPAWKRGFGRDAGLLPDGAIVQCVL